MPKVKLHKGQYKVAVDTHRYRVICAGRRWGKSTLSRLIILKWATEEVGLYWVVAPTRVQAKDVHWRSIKSEIPNGWIRNINESELSAELQNGSIIQLKGCDVQPQRLKGVGLGGLIVDEVAAIRNWDDVWWEALRPTLVDSKAPALFISTPQGFNHFRDLYLMEEKDEDFKSFRFTSYDNPYQDPKEIDKAKEQAIKTQTMEKFEQEYLAKFTKVQGAVYKEWDIDKQFVEINYDPKLPLYLSFDFGVNDPTAIIWVQKMSGEYRVIDYYEANNANVAHFASVINSKPYGTIAGAFGDPAGKARSITTGTSPVEEYSRYDIHIKTKDGVKIPEQIRITHKYIPSLFVSNKLSRFRDCLTNYRYPEKSGNIINQSNEIPIHDEYSHAMRALEYFCVNMHGGVGTGTFEQKMSQFPRQKLYDKYGIPNI